MPTDSYSPALNRILALPIIDYMDPVQYPDLTDTFIRKDGEWYRKGRKLFRHQTAMIYAAVDMAARSSKGWTGMFGVLPVGSGKTLAALLTGTALKAKRIVYITRARLKDQVRREVYEDYAPSFYLTPTIDVHSYSELSAPDASKAGKYTGRLYEWCTAGGMHPGEVLIVFDEAHRLGNPAAARTQRALWDILTMLCMGKSGSDRPKILELTGSVVMESIKNMAHLFYMALGRYSPLPFYLPTKHPDPKSPFQQAIIDPALDGWGQWLDQNARGSWQGSLDMDGLIEAWGTSNVGASGGSSAAELPWGLTEDDLAVDQDPERLAQTEKMRRARQALSGRIASAPGVVMPTAGVESGTNAGILVHYIDDSELELPEVCKRWLDDYREGRVDETIYVCDDDNGENRILKTLSLGFVNKWIWPDGMEPEDQVAWLQARSAWGRFVREELAEHIAPGYDTEGNIRAVIREEMSRRDQEDWEHRHHTLHTWTEAAKRWGRIIKTEAEWVDEFLIDDVMERVAQADRKKEPLLVWYRSLGIMEKLGERGLRVWYGNDCDPKGDAGKSVALSANSHTEGLNLQHSWFNNLILELPGSRPTQQMFGRTHRTLQKAEDCIYSIYAHTPDLKKVVHKVRASAQRDQDLTQDPQKILIAKEI